MLYSAYYITISKERLVCHKSNEFLGFSQFFFSYSSFGFDNVHFLILVGVSPINFLQKRLSCCGDERLSSKTISENGIYLCERRYLIYSNHFPVTIYKIGFIDTFYLVIFVFILYTWGYRFSIERGYDFLSDNFFHLYTCVTSHSRTFYCYLCVFVHRLRVCVL